jgi:hypothetical protein
MQVSDLPDYNVHLRPSPRDERPRRRSRLENQPNAFQPDGSGGNLPNYDSPFSPRPSPRLNPCPTLATVLEDEPLPNFDLLNALQQLQDDFQLDQDGNVPQSGSGPITEEEMDRQLDTMMEAVPFGINWENLGELLAQAQAGHFGGTKSNETQHAESTNSFDQEDFAIIPPPSFGSNTLHTNSAITWTPAHRQSPGCRIPYLLPRGRYMEHGKIAADISHPLDVEIRLCHWTACSDLDRLDEPQCRRNNAASLGSLKHPIHTLRLSVV